MGIRFEFLKAGNGDCILISVDNQSINILIDGGLPKTYNMELKKKLESIKNKNSYLDLVVLTHYDNDHIGGILKLLDSEKKSIKNSEKTIIKEFWFNSFDNALVNYFTTSNQTSAKQQIKFDEYIKELIPYIKYQSKISIDNKQEIFLGKNQELKFTLLSPNNQKLDELFSKFEKEVINYKTSAHSSDSFLSIEELSTKQFKSDTSLTNGASIAFILEYEKLKFLFLGDAHIDLIVESLQNLGYSKNNRLKLEFIKLSHHGSSKNLNSEFLDLVETNKFIILTNGGRHNHPNKETLAKILTYHKREKDKNGHFKNDIEFIYNYPQTKEILTPYEKRAYKALFSDREVAYL